MDKTNFKKKTGLEGQGLGPAFFKRLLRSDPQLYYSTPELNEILYLHYLGAEKLEGLEPFPELRVLYLEGNAIKRIEGMEELGKLRCLYLQENLIERIENLAAQRELISLNLSDNLISRVENLEENCHLEMLQLRRNRLGVNGLGDLEGLTVCPRLASLDIAANRIDCDDPESFLSLLERIPSLSVLYLYPNPVCAKIQNYRKTLIARVKGLKYLDDRPVFAEDRRFAEAFKAGGTTTEMEERRKHREEEREKHMRNHLAFKAMLEGRPEAPAEPVAQFEEDSSQHSSQLETYVTEEDDSKAKEDCSLSRDPPSASQEEDQPSVNLLDELD